MKSHFTFTREQRNGIFLLLTLIFISQCFYFFVDFPSDKVDVDEATLLKFTKKIDSLKRIQPKEKKLQFSPFNPNFITDFKGSILGMSNAEIDRFLKYRKQNKWVNSSMEFQEVTKISDSLLFSIMPYFKFPEWVKDTKKENSNVSKKYKKKIKVKADLNTATAIQLQMVKGIGKVLSERIIKFRNKNKGGFISDIQLQDVYGLPPETIKEILTYFTVKTPQAIQKINLNTASIEELVSIPHIDYDLAYDIVEYKQLIEGYKHLHDLLKVKGFPIKKIKIIELYLHIQNE